MEPRPLPYLYSRAGKYVTAKEVHLRKTWHLGSTDWSGSDCSGVRIAGGDDAGHVQPAAEVISPLNSNNTGQCC